MPTDDLWALVDFLESEGLGNEALCLEARAELEQRGERYVFSVLRGGSWYRSAEYSRSACRGGYVPGDRGLILGFRVASNFTVVHSNEESKMKKIHDKLSGGSDGPTMVELQGGKFRMGSPEGVGLSDEHPQHEVAVEAFAVGEFPVTFDEYDRFCEATGREKPGDEGWGRGRRPVINVSWHDAAAYCKWLSEETGETYRLLTEAEWEYACRAGSDTKYCYGDDEQRLGDYAWFFENSGMKTHPVGQKLPNAWGLYDMHGNVWEWCADEYRSYDK